MVVSSNASSLSGKSRPELTEGDLELQKKIIQIIGEYGPTLLSTPISDLRKMADTPCIGDNTANIFGQIWDRYRFVPTAGILRALGSDDNPELPALIDLMERIWDEAPVASGTSIQDVA